MQLNMHLKLTSQFHSVSCNLLIVLMVLLSLSCTRVSLVQTGKSPIVQDINATIPSENPFGPNKPNAPAGPVVDDAGKLLSGEYTFENSIAAVNPIPAPLLGSPPLEGIKVRTYGGSVDIEFDRVLNAKDYRAYIYSLLIRRSPQIQTVPSQYTMQSTDALVNVREF